MWVRGIKEVRWEMRFGHPDRAGRWSILEPVRVVTEYPASALPVTGVRRLELPTTTGAGPCGTYARNETSPATMSWSVLNILVPLAVFYANYRPPLRKLSPKMPRLNTIL